MTVYVHRNNRVVGYGDHFHEAPANTDERVWSFDCVPACEERICRDVEHAARTKEVPLTVEETDEEEALKVTAQKDVTKMAMALSKLANESAAEGA